MTKFSPKYRCINHLPSNQRWRFSENPPSTEIIFPCLPGEGHDRRDRNWAPQGDFSNSAWREQAMERVAKELETGACALILFRKPSPSWLHLKKSSDMITLGRVLSYATEIIGASGSIRALSSFREASSPPRALSGTFICSRLVSAQGNPTSNTFEQNLVGTCTSTWKPWSQTYSIWGLVKPSACGEDGSVWQGHAIDYIASTAKGLGRQSSHVWNCCHRRPLNQLWLRKLRVEPI